MSFKLDTKLPTRTTLSFIVSLVADTDMDPEDWPREELLHCRYDTENRAA